MDEVFCIGSSFNFHPFDGFHEFLEVANHHLTGRIAVFFQCDFLVLRVVVQEEIETFSPIMHDFFFCGVGVAVRSLQATNTRPDGASGGRDVTQIESSSLLRAILKFSLLHAGNRSCRPSIHFGYSTFEKRRKTEEEVKKMTITITRPTMRSVP